MSKPASAPIRKIIRLQAKPGFAGLMRQELLKLEETTRLEPGCEAFSFFQALADDASFILVEAFVDEAAFQHHMQLPHTKTFFAQNLVTLSTPLTHDWMHGA